MNANGVIEMTNVMQEFLVSSYFGDINGKNLIEICANRAYLDLARRVPYLYSVSKLDDMKKSHDANEQQKASTFELQKQNFKAGMTEELMRQISDKKLPHEIIKAIQYKATQYDVCIIGQNFGFGLCQKWVNMTLKYLWLFGKCPIGEDKLDVPIDSYIIHAAVSEKSEEQPYGLSVKVDGLQKDTAWSTMDESLYNAIQNEIAKAIQDSGREMTKIQWENKAWINQAKIEA